MNAGEQSIKAPIPGTFIILHLRLKEEVNDEGVYIHKLITPGGEIGLVMRPIEFIF